MRKPLIDFSSIAVAGILTAAIAIAAPNAASANAQTCTPTIVAYDPNRLWVQCSETGPSVTFFAWTTAGGGQCGITTDLDTLKVWASMTQAAFLSGRHLKILFNPPAGSCANNSVAEFALLP